MTVNFDYRDCTVEELADYVEVSSAGRITQQLIYYQKREVVEMVEKIKAARLLVKKRKLLRLLSEME